MLRQGRTAGVTKIKLQLHEVQRIVRERLGAHANHAVADTALERTHRLPLKPIFRIAVGMALRDDASAQALPCQIIVTLRAGEIELALSRVEQSLARLIERSHRTIDRDLHLHAARLKPDIGRQSEQRVAVRRQRCRFLSLDTTLLDALRQGDRPAEMRIECRVARCHATHRRRRGAMAVGAASPRAARALRS